MPKNLLQDMVKVKHPRERIDSALGPIQTGPKALQNQNRDRPRYTLWFVAIISLLFFIFSLSYFFLKVVVTVNPKIKDVVLNENLSASKDSNDNGLFFNLVGPISGEDSKTVQANTPKDVSNKATGTVVIYNTFGFSPQPLNIDTRLVGSNGKIYKTLTRTVVPGMNKDGTAGQVEVEIYANVAGSDYNSAPLDFYILGFKGTLKYAKFKVRSKTGTEIVGGFVGKVNVISDADKTSALAELNLSLKAKLLAKLTSQIPSGFVLFKDAVFLSTQDPIIPLNADQNNNFTITLGGTLDGLLFNENNLTKKIAEDNIENYDESEVYIPNIKDLTFSLSNKDNVSFADMKNIDFNLSGSAKIVWKLDESKLIADLLGKSKKDFDQILLQYPNIDSAQLSFSPFWRMSFPDKSKDIKVIVNYPNLSQPSS